MLYSHLLRCITWYNLHLNTCHWRPRRSRDSTFPLGNQEKVLSLLLLLRYVVSTGNKSYNFTTRLVLKDEILLQGCQRRRGHILLSKMLFFPPLACGTHCAVPSNLYSHSLDVDYSRDCSVTVLCTGTDQNFHLFRNGVTELLADFGH
jgi:hypothetical protein